jgi:hypothetical protein
LSGGGWDERRGKDLKDGAALFIRSFFLFLVPKLLFGNESK